MSPTDATATQPETQAGAPAANDQAADALHGSTEPSTDQTAPGDSVLSAVAPSDEAAAHGVGSDKPLQLPKPEVAKPEALAIGRLIAKARDALAVGDSTQTEQLRAAIAEADTILAEAQADG